MDWKAKEGITFLELPFSSDKIHFISSPESKEFQYLLYALKNSTLIGLDSEWKPVVGQTAGASSPRVSILQIASRFYDCADWSKEIERADSTRYGNIEDKLILPGDTVAARVGDRLHDSEKSLEKGWNLDEFRKKQFLVEEGNTIENENIVIDAFAKMNLEETVERDRKQGKLEEAVFILDMLVLPLCAYKTAMKTLLRCSKVLKLGFKFQQDLLYLADTFQGYDSEACFHKVEPYVDIGKLYRHLEGTRSCHMHRGKKIFIESTSLANICEDVLGVPLCKDMQCSNWEQRPLTSEQISYAAVDAYCLLAIYDVLGERVSKASGETSEKSLSTGEMAEDPTSSVCRRIGVAELLQPADVVQKDKDHAGIVFKQRNGLASSVFNMQFSNGSPSWYKVFEGERVFISMALKVSPDTAFSYMKKNVAIIEKFGERLLAYGGREAAKCPKRRVRSRRARQLGRRDSTQQSDNEVIWQGPPPWDPSIGGDGSPKFLCDSMIEGLARQLRCVGIDTAYPQKGKVEVRKLVEQAQKEGRVLLTRDTKLLRRRLISANLAYHVKSLPKQEQLLE